jgi:hypothetical protein
MRNPAAPAEAPALAAGAAVLAVPALFAFSPSYFERFGTGLPALIHLHAWLMGLWCALLVVQPLLIASGRRPIHRRLGLLAWGLAPAIVGAALALAVTLTRPAAGARIEDFRYALFPIQLLSALLFGLCVGMALRHRRQPLLHGRWMLGSALTLVDPVLARVLAQWPPTAGPGLWADYGSATAAAGIGALIAWRQRAGSPGRGVAFGVGLAVLATNLLGQFAARLEGWRGSMDRLFG